MAKRKSKNSYHKKFSSGKLWALGVGTFLGLTLLFGLMLFAMADQDEATPVIVEKHFFDDKAQSILKLTNETETNGGTGFQVRGPSGHKYVMTNEHICQLGAKEGQLLATTERGDRYHLRIIKISETADLCLLEAAPGLPALSIARESYAGQYVMVIGHPYLNPTEIAAGVLLGLVPITVGEIVGPNDKCNRYGERLEVEQSRYGTRRLCLRTLMAFHTNVHVYPGNSGSPTLDLQGRVVGVAFATSLATYWGSLVPLMDVQDFMVGY